MDITFLENPDIWLIAGVGLIIFEIFIGSLVLFLPLGISSLCIGLILKFQVNFDFIIIPSWAYALVTWGLISIVFSYLIQKFFKKKEPEDVNSY
tara:strand:- start:9163 stop:9444 length:282 start_codon:yes stop_codon:yes gene_type:complete